MLVASATGRRMSAVHWASRACAIAAIVAPSASGQGLPLWQANGLGIGDETGQAVGAAGDLNGDGTPDVVAGAWRADPGGLADAGFLVALSGSTGAPLWAVFGTAPNDGLGWAAAGVGDVNGDGLDDVVVAAITASPGGLLEAGQAKVVSGATGTILYTFDGVGPGDRFGRGVSGAGDVDADGTPDVVVGAYNHDVGLGLADAGQVRVFSGANGSVLLTVNGAAADDRFGTSVAGPGDVDGDGFDDLLVGAQLASAPGLFWAGTAYVISGASGATIHTFYGLASLDRLGYSVAAPGDVNADGVPDFLVGAWLADPGGQPDVGQAFVFSGLDGSTLHTLNGTVWYEHLGLTVSAVGDVDGDGKADLLTGSPEYALTVPSGEGMAKIFSGATGNLLFQLDGAAIGDAFGRCVAGPGDVNGDGFPDVFAGAYQACCPPATVPGTGYVRLDSLVGLPPGVAALGAGCAGSGGFVPQLAAFGGSPVVGNAGFGFAISRGVGGSLAFPFLATSSSPSGIPVAGCNVHLAGVVLQFGPAVVLGGAAGVPGAGYRMRGVPIPAAASLVGLSLTVQFSALDLGSPNGLFVFTNALTLTIG